MKTGTVKFFNETKGFGFILTDDNKDIFVFFIKTAAQVCV